MTVDISEDDALVLFDLLSDRGRESGGRSLVIRSAAERNALWHLEAALERSLVPSLEKSYADQVREARERLEREGGSW